MAYEEKKFLDNEGLKNYHQKISAKINATNDYNNLTNKPDIPSFSFNETTETLTVG